MKQNSETETLDDICRKAGSNQEISDEDLLELQQVFGQRSAKALEVLRENRVKKYIFKPSNRVVWVVVGKGRDYLLMTKAEFCTCDDFYFRVLDRQIHMCYHLVAQRLAEASGSYETVEADDELYDSLMNEWKKPTA